MLFVLALAGAVGAAKGALHLGHQVLDWNEGRKGIKTASAEAHGTLVHAGLDLILSHEKMTELMKHPLMVEGVQNATHARAADVLRGCPLCQRPRVAEEKSHAPAAR